MGVTIETPIDTLEGIGQRYLFSRSIAGELRCADVIPNACLALSRLALLCLLLWRLCQVVHTKFPQSGWKVKSYLLLLLIVRVFGEVVGYLFGQGDSVERVV